MCRDGRGGSVLWLLRHLEWLNFGSVTADTDPSSHPGFAFSSIFGTTGMISICGNRSLQSHSKGPPNADPRGKRLVLYALCPTPCQTFCWLLLTLVFLELQPSFRRCLVTLV